MLIPLLFYSASFALCDFTCTGIVDRVLLLGHFAISDPTT